jgi:xylan 1,4-beta-xylosidase
MTSSCISRHPWLATPAVAVVVWAMMLGCGMSAAEPDGSVAEFDWFEYSGHDSVYRANPAGRSEYHNPILAGFYPDPTVIRVGEDYYLANSSFAYFPGVPIFRSTDLVSWTQIGSVLDRPSQLAVDSAGISRGIFAPALSHHAGTFYLITTVADRGNFYVTATNPAGPWSDPVWLPEVDGIDPSLFFDGDGKAYVVNNGPPVGAPRYGGHRAIWIQELDLAAKRMTGPRAVIVNGGVDIRKKPIWIEGPHIFERNGTYYLICAEGGTADQHSEVVFRSTSVRGPYVPYAGNPILTQRHLPASRPFPVSAAGHADFVETQNGEWWAVFLAARPYEDEMFNTGRETFLLPVRWVDGWPVILTGDAPVPYVHARPNLPAQPAPAVPLSGNFTVRDELDRGTLAPYWTFIRTVRSPFYDLSTSPGFLRLNALPARLGERRHLAFVGRRQQHTQMSASAAMRYRPAKPGDAAGLVAFQSDDYNYLLAVTLAGGRPVAQLVKRAGQMTGDSSVVIASAPLAIARDGVTSLRIDARGKWYDFYYATTPGAWIALAKDVDGTILSTKVAGGFSSAFVGTVIGMYATTAAGR